MSVFVKWLGILLVLIGVAVIGDQVLPEHQQAQVNLETGGDLEFEHFDQPRNIQWIGRPQRVLTYSRLVVETRDNQDTASPVFIVEPEDTQRAWGELLTRTLVIRGRWVGNACGYWQDQYGQCIPWVEIESVTSP